MLFESSTVPPTAFAARTGWEARPEGLCKGDRCVPIPDVVTDDGSLEVAKVAAGLGMALVTDGATKWSALGPESGGPSLTTAVAPDLELPDRDGNPFRLRSLIGRKMLLVAWASW